MKLILLIALAAIGYGGAQYGTKLYLDRSEERVLTAYIEITPTAEVIPTITNTPIPTPEPTAEPTITMIPSPTTVASPTSTVAPIPTVVPTFAVTQIKATSEQINGFINSFGAEYKVDPNVIRHVALCESGFNPNAKNLTYGGLFQFSPTTWSSWRNKMQEDANTELRFNAEEAVQTAAFVLSLGKGSIWPNCMP